MRNLPIRQSRLSTRNSGIKWNYTISYVNQALRTGFYCGTLYYIRGFAYESLGDFKSAKKDYKTGKKYDSVEAAQALEQLKVKMKQRRK